MVALADLVRELKALRKGRGLLASHIGDRIGSALRAICDVRDDDGPAVIRQKVAQRLEILAGELPADLRIAVLAAFAIAPDARLPFYQDRVSWTARRLNRDPRTARRRIDAGIDHIAQLATVRPVPAARQAKAAAAPAATGWRTLELRVIALLDRTHPEVVELHRIVAGRDDLAVVDVPVPAAADVLYGATHAGRGTVTLPRALSRGDEHEFGLRYRVPDAAAPHLVRTPDHPCDLFDLRLRFDRARPPWRIWLLAGALDRDLAGPERTGEARETDAAGELHLVFRDLTPGLAYGARWDRA
ncbi:MAG TPA: hypothetical protein VGP26_17260 [Actinophytocola sp.]|jgi:hypothetical protein|nr:hypothetical protein [Actinophytocola sp.]